MAKNKTTTKKSTGRPKGSFGPTGLGSKTFGNGGKASTKKKCKC